MKKWIVLVMALLVLIPCAALAADYTIERYDMTVDVLADGSADVTETLEYRFDGDHNGILSAFDVGEVGGLEDLALYVDGSTKLHQVYEMDYEPYTYTAEPEGKFIHVRAYAPGGRGTRVFRYEYRLTDLCQRYRDAARLNYKLIGTQNQVALHNARIALTLPGAASDAWAHGAMGNEDVRREGGALVYGPKDVQPGQFVEADVLFDAASLSGAPLDDRAVVNEVRALEAELAEKARAEQAAQAARMNMARRIMTVLFGAVAACWAAMLFWLERSVGFQRRGPEGELGALEGVRAAVAQWVHAGKVDTDAVTGTLLELVQLGAVELIKPEKDGDAPAFVRKQTEPAGLAGHQQLALSWLFQGGRPLYPDSLDACGSEQRAKAYMTQFGNYKKRVREEAAERGYISARNGKLWLPIVLCAVLFVLSFLLFALESALMGAVALALGIASIVLCCRLRRLTDEGERVDAALRALIAQGSQGAEPRKDLMPYLPNIAALGGLDPFFDRVDLNAWRRGDDYPYWMYCGWHRDMGRMRRGFSDSYSHNQSALSKSSDSGGSSGGGSSGGGGGGGGHGAW